MCVSARSKRLFMGFLQFARRDVVSETSPHVAQLTQLSSHRLWQIETWSLLLWGGGPLRGHPWQTAV